MSIESIKLICATIAACALLGSCTLVEIYGSRESTAEYQCASKATPSQWCFEYLRALQQRGKP